MDFLSLFLKKYQISQNELGRRAGISSATMSRMRRGMLPPAKAAAYEERLRNTAKGFASPEDMNLLTASLRIADKQQPMTPPGEEPPMFLRRQTLLPETRKKFGLFRDPFVNDVRGPDDLWLSPDTRYIREEMRTTAQYGGMLAVVGESGAGKSTLRRDLVDWVAREDLVGAHAGMGAGTGIGLLQIERLSGQRRPCHAGPPDSQGLGHVEVHARGWPHPQSISDGPARILQTYHGHGCFGVVFRLSKKSDHRGAEGVAKPGHDKAEIKADRAELLEDLVAQIAATLGDYGIAEDVAIQAGHAAADWIATHWGGSQIYLPKDFHFRHSQRDQEIYDESRKPGVTPNMLAKKYHITLVRIYQIIATVRTANFTRRQGRLQLDLDGG